MDRTDRDGRDAGGVGPYAREREQLVPMSTLESWTVSEGEPDIRGWEVRTVAGRQLGAVSDLWVDVSAGEVVLVDIDLPGTGGHTFVPVRLAQIDRARRVVLMDSADLPEPDGARAESPATTARRAPDTGTVRYPRGDREVFVNRPSVADDAVIYDSSAGPGDVSADDNERRRAERRRIDRLGTEF